jgi:hypothetical protein
MFEGGKWAGLEKKIMHGSSSIQVVRLQCDCRLKLHLDKKMKKLLSVIFIFALCSCAADLPTKHYDASKNTQQQFDHDSGYCNMLMAKEFGGQFNAPINFLHQCMKTLGWHD